jgi:glycine cleavage system H lipoate-binding protein
MILAFALGVVFLILAGLWGLLLLGERGRVRVRQWRMGLERLHGFLIHPGLFYHPGHTWVMAEANGSVRVGIDDFGRRLLDGVRKVELPRRGTAVRQGETAVGLACGKKGARLLSPVDGVVTAVNKAVIEGGRALETDPYGKGWLFRVKVSDRSFSRLPTGAAALDWFKRETDRLGVFLHAELGVTAADGGELVSAPARLLDEHQWESLVETFFRPARSGDSKSDPAFTGKEAAR